MRLIDADALCKDLLERWSVAETRKEELVKAVMADIVTPIIILQPTIEPEAKLLAEVKLSKEELQEVINKTPEKIRKEMEHPERKKGKWLRSGNCIFPYECDQCGDTNERATPFCPNCGAKMER